MKLKNSKKKALKHKRDEFLWGWLFILPTMLGLVILNIIPIMQTIYQSFFRTGDFGRGNIFIGVENYIRLINDTDVWHAVWNTLRYVFLEVPLSIIISLILAALLNRKIKFRGLYRTIFFLPMVVAPAAIAMVWRWIYNSRFGLINNVFGLNVNWISDPRIAIYSIAVIGIWAVIGFNMVLFLAALQEVPKDYYEAAKIDGASGLQQFLKITIPLISPIIFFVSVTRIIAAFQLFDLIFMVMERENPALRNTQSLVYLFFRHAFTERNVGYASAIVVLLLVLIIIVTFIQIKISKKLVHYN